MFDNYKRLDLQLFADGGAGDGGAEGGAQAAETGDNPADAGRKYLLEHKTPASAITDGRALAVGKALAKSQGAKKNGADGNAGKQAAAAENRPDSKGGSEPPGWKLPEGTTWEQIMSVPEMNREMQKIVKLAKKDGGKAQEALSALAPALELLAKHHGMDAANLDYAELAKKIGEDDTLYEAEALRMGVDVQTARRMVQQEQQTQRENRQRQQAQQETWMQEHYLSLVEQGKAMAQKYPGFDLKAEMANPTFQRLTHPSLIQAMGGLEGVYEHVHREELRQQREQTAAELARQQVAQSIQAGGYRPGELGGGQPPTSVADLPMTPERAREIAQLTRKGVKVAL